MLNNEAAAADALQLSVCNARGTTTTGSWLDVRGYEGRLLLTQLVGVVTGTTPTLDGKIQDATDISGTGSADVAGAVFTQVTAANSVQKMILGAKQTRGFIRYVGTIGGTTPVFNMAVMLNARPKAV